MKSSIFLIASAAAATAAAVTICPYRDLLLKNPGFEDSASSPAPWTAPSSGLRVVKPGELSSNALQVTYNTTANDASFYQPVLVDCPGTYVLVFSYRYKTNKTATNSISVGVGSNSYNIVSKQSTQWQHYSNFARVTSQTNGSFTLTYFKSEQGASDILFDNFQFQLANFNDICGAAENVKNGGFESGKLAPWVLTGDGGVRQNFGIDGTYGFRITPRQNVTVSTKLAQNVTLTAGKAYRFSTDYYYPNVPTQQSFFSIGFAIDSVNGGAFLGSDIATRGRGKIYRDFIAPANLVEVSISPQYGLFDNSRWGPALIDNLSIKEIA